MSPSPLNSDRLKRKSPQKRAYWGPQGLTLQRVIEYTVFGYSSAPCFSYNGFKNCPGIR